VTVPALLAVKCATAASAVGRSDTTCAHMCV